MIKTKIMLIFSSLLLMSLGCTLQTKNEVEVKPMHITIDVNLKIQEELKEKFKTLDEKAKAISDKEAEEALNKYLEAQSKNI